jgi:hypothetical protein
MSDFRRRCRCGEVILWTAQTRLRFKSGDMSPHSKGHHG